MCTHILSTNNLEERSSSFCILLCYLEQVFLVLIINMLSDFAPSNIKLTHNFLYFTENKYLNYCCDVLVLKMKDFIQTK